MDIATELQQLEPLLPLDKISFLPLSWLGYLAVFAGAMLLVQIIGFSYSRLRYIFSDKYQYIREIKRLKRKNKGAATKVTARELSELVRKVAISSHARNSCASLTEDAWMEWLTKNDPNKFDWYSYRQELCVYPYKASAPGIASSDVLSILYALERWLRP